MVFHVQPLTYYDAHTRQITINVPVTRPYIDPSSPSRMLCRNGVTELASRTAKLAAATFGFLARGRRRRRMLTDLELLVAKPYFGKLRRFSLEELEAATDGFGDRSRVGAGGFGTVYKGILADGSVVAIKQLGQVTNYTVDEFRRELEVGSMDMAIDRNVIQVYGYCITITSKKVLLVYPFMANGSLEAFLREPFGSPELHSRHLSWPTRKKIALGIAKGVAYLHESCHLRIVHRDLKPSNILLSDDFEPLISDFGIARFMDRPVESLIELPVPNLNRLTESAPHNYETTRIVGTIGYLAPEYAMLGQLSEKNDVYAFGIIILQLASGWSRHCCSQSNGDVTYLLDWIVNLVEADQLELAVDQNLQGEQHIEEEVQNLIKLGLICVRHRPELRPKMTQVITMLEGTALIEGCQEFRQEIDRLRSGTLRRTLMCGQDAVDHGSAHFHMNSDAETDSTSYYSMPSPNNSSTP